MTRIAFEPRFEEEYECGKQLLLSRQVAKNSSDAECLDLASTWLQRCSRFHGRSHCFPLDDVLLPTRLVYIPCSSDENLQLQRTEGLMGRYVTLSYCWGGTSKAISMTTRSTLNSMESGFRVEQLPKTLQDAISITRRLGFQYIWIDSLCIIQEDSEDWARESGRMAQVYGNASLTLCSDLAKDSDEGIFQLRDTLTSHSFGSDGQYCLQSRHGGWARITFNPLSTRGWALQERMLSQRMLHFIDTQMAWECRSALYLETDRCGYRETPGGHFIVGEFSQYLPAAQVHEGLDLWTQLGAFNRVVAEQAVRDFSVPADRLSSLSGLVSSIQIPELGRYIAGVWENQPFACMAWYTRYSQHDVTGYRAPSWSWASTRGQLISRPGWWRPGLSSNPTGKLKTGESWEAKFHPICPKQWLFRSDDRDQEWSRGLTWSTQYQLNSEDVSLSYPNKLPSKGGSAWKFLEAEWEEEWLKWAIQFYPALLGHNIIYESTNQGGHVLEGSYIVIRGACRAVYMVEGPSNGKSVYNYWMDSAKTYTPKIRKQLFDDHGPERKVYMDKRDNTENKVYFDGELEGMDDGFKERMKEYLCLQIGKERLPVLPKVVSLVLEKVEGVHEAWKRAGLMTSDDPDPMDEIWQAKWETKILKLI